MLFDGLWHLLERSRGHGGQYIYYIWAPIIYIYQRKYSLYVYFSTQMWDSVAIWRRSMLKQLEKFIPINNYKRIKTPTLGIEYTNILILLTCHNNWKIEFRMPVMKTLQMMELQYLVIKTYWFFFLLEPIQYITLTTYMSK